MEERYFSMEQVVQIVVLACETPQESEYPVSHWTPTELAAEAIKGYISNLASPLSIRTVPETTTKGTVPSHPRPISFAG